MKFVFMKVLLLTQSKLHKSDKTKKIQNFQ